jgi:hypothetical protein
MSSSNKCTCSDANRQADDGPLPEAPTQTWTAADLCTQCASVDLAHILESFDPFQYPESKKLWLRTSMASNCPLCRFLLTIIAGKYPSTDPHAEIELGLYVKELTDSFYQLSSTNRDADKSQSPRSVHVIGLDTKGFEAVRDKEHGEMFCPEFTILPVCESPAGNEPPAFSFRQLRPTSIDFTILRGWLGYCNNHHAQTCDTFPGYPQEVPGLRVIDCQTGSIIDAPKGCQFAALSYVWGESSVREMGNARCRGSLPDDVPRIIGDAMEVVLRLHLQYLWVDQYCIDQSNETELQQFISAMDMIYHLATVTIIGASGKDASFGLPGVGLTPRERQPTANLNGRIWISSLENPKTRIKRSKWFSRGWTYQEGLFSRRRLIFTEEQVYFECNNIQCWETLAYDLHHLLVEDNVCSTSLFQGAFSHEYVGGLDTFIQQYTMRDLSFQKDAINAMGGVFRAFSAMPSPVRHIRGIPTDLYYSEYIHAVDSPWPPNKEPLTTDESPGHLDSKFARALCWLPSGPAKRREGFPSWSWAGWVGSLRRSYPWGRGYSVDESPNVKIWLRRNDGTYDRLSESVIASENQQDGSASVYTPILRIEACTMKVRIKYFAGGFPDTETHFQHENPEPTYFVFLTVTTTDPPSLLRGKHYWPVTLSAQVTEGDDVHQELCEREFDCILLGDSSGIGLIVRRIGDFMERFGHVDLFWSQSEYYPHDPKLSDYIPGQRRSMLLR